MKKWGALERKSQKMKDTDSNGPNGKTTAGNRSDNEEKESNNAQII